MTCLVQFDYRSRLESSYSLFEIVERVAQKLPEIIAQGWFYQRDVEVVVRPTGPLDQNRQDFNITVWAKKVTQGPDELQSWMEKIQTAIEKEIPNRYSLRVRIFEGPCILIDLDQEDDALELTQDQEIPLTQ